MKIQIEFETVSSYGIDELITEFETLQKLHIKETECKDPIKCDATRNLWWLIAQLKNVKKQVETFNDGTFKYKEEKDVTQ